MPDKSDEEALDELSSIFMEGLKEAMEEREVEEPVNTAAEKMKEDIEKGGPVSEFLAVERAGGYEMIRDLIAKLSPLHRERMRLRQKFEAPKADVFLFLDDTRDPQDVYPGTSKVWDVVRTPRDFRKYVNYAPQTRLVVSLDHDLGAEETGMDLVKWMARKGIKPAAYAVHSANVSGAKNMERFMSGWMENGTRGEPWDPQEAMQNLADQAQDLGMYDE